MKKKLAALTALLIAAPAVCWATDYYVREDGSAANKETAVDCLLASTAMSVTTHNAETFSPGDNIYLCDDVAITAAINPPSSGSSGNYITYHGDSDADGIDAEVQGGIQRLLQQRAWLKFQDIKFTTSAKGLVLAQGANHIWVTGCEFNALTQQGIFGSGLVDTAYAEDWLIENSIFTNIGISSDSASADINPSGFSRRWAARNTTHTGDGTHGVDAFTVSVNNVAGADGSGFVIDGMSCTGYYENCVDFKGVKESSAGEGDSIVRNSTLSGSTGAEALLHVHFNSTGVLIEKTRFLDTPNNAIALPGHGVGEDTVGNVDVEYCLFSGIAKDIFVDAGLTDAEAVGLNSFTHNTCINSGTSTLGYSIDIGSNGNTFTNNIFYNSSIAAVNDMIFRFNTGAFYDSAILDYNIYKKASEVTLTVVSVTAVDNKTVTEMQADGNEVHGYYTDPRLDSQGRPRNPAVWNAGSFIDGQKYSGSAPAIGAFDRVPGLMFPGKGALSQMPSWNMGDQGRLYTPIYSGNYFFDGATVFLDGSTYFVDGGL
jgi:hypothetical protein